jgi:hypothetical protein
MSTAIFTSKSFLRQMSSPVIHAARSSVGVAAADMSTRGISRWECFVVKASSFRSYPLRGG